MTRPSLGKVDLHVCIHPLFRDYLMDEARKRNKDVSQIVEDYINEDMQKHGVPVEGGCVYRESNVSSESVDGADGVGSGAADGDGAEGRGSVDGDAHRQACPSTQKRESKSKASGHAHHRPINQAEAEARVRESLGPDWKQPSLKKSPHEKSPHGRDDGAAQKRESKSKASGHAHHRPINQAEAEARVRESLGPDWKQPSLKKSPHEKSPHGRGDGAVE